MELLLFILIFIVIPVTLGYLLLCNCRINKKLANNSDIPNALQTKKEPSIFESWILGLVFLLALFQICAIPFILTTRDFLPVFYLWISLIILLGVISLAFNTKSIANSLKNLLLGIKDTPFILIAAIIVIGYQVFYVTFFSHSDADDSYYIPQALEALSSNKIFWFNPYNGNESLALNPRYALSSYSIFVAALSKILTIHPTIIFHTVFPFIFTTAAYIVYYMIADRLFDHDQKKSGCFLLFISALNIFGGQSVYTSSSFLLLRIWQGKAFLVAVVLPLLLWTLLKIAKREEKTGDWVVMLIINIAATAASSMAVYLTLILLWSFGLVYSIIQKRFKPMLMAISTTTINFLMFGIHILL